MSKQSKPMEYKLTDLQGKDTDKDLHRIRNYDNQKLVKLYKLFQKDPVKFRDMVSKQIGSGWIEDTRLMNLEPIRQPVPTSPAWDVTNYPLITYPYTYFDMDIPPKGFKGMPDQWMFHNFYQDPLKIGKTLQKPNIFQEEHLLRRAQSKGGDGFTFFEIRFVPMDWLKFKGEYDSTEKMVDLIKTNYPVPIDGRVPLPLDPPDTGVNRVNLIEAYIKNMTEYLITYFGSSKQKDEIGRKPTENELYEFVRSIVALYVKQHNFYFNNVLPYQEELDRMYQVATLGIDTPPPPAPEITLDPREFDLQKMLADLNLQFKYPTANFVFTYGPPMNTFDNPELAQAVTTLHPRNGGLAYVPNAPLIPFLEKFNRKYIVSPFGTYYYTTVEKTSFFKGMIDTNMKRRKTEKKLMLDAKKKGDTTAAKFHNNMQGLIKINMNSMPGAMGSGFNFLSNRPNFNSVTSIARFFIMNSYAHAERFLEGNFYFRNEEQLVNFIMTCKLYGPDPADVTRKVKALGLYIPSWSEVYEFLKSQLDKYTPYEAREYPTAQRLIASANTGQLLFLFYMSNMKHLVQKNDHFFKPWVKDFISPGSLPVNPSLQPSDIKKLDGDLGIVLSTIYTDLLPTNEKGNSISIYDCIDQAPDLAVQLCNIGNYMQSKIDQIQPVFDVFMKHKVGIGFVAEHRQMKRDAVILSDTDSIIFTTKSWLKWYTGDLKLSNEAFGLNALVVYWLTKANSNILLHVSKAFGAVGPDLKTMAMKNEFMMPVEILTTLKKHYAAIWKIQEGVVYNKPVLDIKGVGLRGSDYCASTLEYAKWYIQSTIDEIYETGKVSIQEKLLDVARLERYIYDTLVNGDPTFLTVEPVKTKDEYKDSSIGIYFNYQFWEDIFGDKYGHIAIPTKCFLLPLTNVRSQTFRERLSAKYPDIYERLMKFFEKYPDKDLTRIPLNPLVDKIPDELRPVINYRSIIYANCRPMYIILQSLGYTFGNAKYVHLVSDVCGWVDRQEADKVEAHLK